MCLCRKYRLWVTCKLWHIVINVIIFFPVSLWPIQTCSSCWHLFGTKDCQVSGGKICYFRVWKSSASACSSHYFPSSTSWRRIHGSGRPSENLSSNLFATPRHTSLFSVSSLTCSYTFQLIGDFVLNSYKIWVDSIRLITKSWRILKLLSFKRSPIIFLYKYIG